MLFSSYKKHESSLAGMAESIFRFGIFSSFRWLCSHTRASPQTTSKLKAKALPLQTPQRVRASLPARHREGEGNTAPTNTTHNSKAVLLGDYLGD